MRPCAHGQRQNHSVFHGGRRSATFDPQFQRQTFMWSSNITSAKARGAAVPYLARYDTLTDKCRSHASFQAYLLQAGDSARAASQRFARAL